MQLEGKIVLNGLQSGSSCWFPENGLIQNGQAVKALRNTDCCSSGSLKLMSDGIIYVDKLDSSIRKCLMVDNMPISQLQQLEGRSLRLNTGK